MSLASLTVKGIFEADGVTQNFAIPFVPIEDDSVEISVYTRNPVSDPVEVLLMVEGVDYDLSGAPDVDSFNTTVTFVIAPDSDLQVIILSNVSITQPLDATANGRFLLVDHEREYDRLTRICQQLSEKLTRVPILNLTLDPIGEGWDLELPVPEASTVFGWNDTADAIILYTADDLMSLAGALIAANNLSDLTDPAQALVNLGISPQSAQIDVSFTNSQAATAVVGESYAGSAYKSVVYEYQIIQGTTIMANGRFAMQYLNGTWRPMDMGYYGDTHGITFSITQVGTVGQLKIAEGGLGNGTFVYKKNTFVV